MPGSTPAPARSAPPAAEPIGAPPEMGIVGGPVSKRPQEPQRAAPLAAPRGGAGKDTMAPQQAPKGDKSEYDPRSINMSQDELTGFLRKMHSMGIKGFNFGGRAFLADNDMPSGYRVIHDENVSIDNLPDSMKRGKTNKEKSDNKQ